MIEIIGLCLICLGVVLLLLKAPEPSFDVSLISVPTKRLIGGVLIAAGLLLILGHFVSENQSWLPRIGKRMF
jgi:hypothetical protein